MSLVVVCVRLHIIFVFFFFNDTATTEIYTLSLHDALPISINGTPVGSIPRRSLRDVDYIWNTGVNAYTPNPYKQLLRVRSEEHTSELQSRPHLVCRLLLEKKNITTKRR